MARFCNKCNSPIEEGGYFCTECGSNDIRDDSVQAQPVAENNQPAPPQENTNNPTTEIPEMATGATSSFGDKTVEQMQNTTIQPIANSQVNTNSPAATPTNSFADVPDYLTGQQELNIPKGFQLQEGPGNDYNIQAQAQAQQGQANRYAQRRPKKKSGGNTALKIIFAIVGIIALGCLIYFVYSYGKKTGSGQFTNSETTPGNTSDVVDYSKIFTPENSFRVGNATTGYISIPNTWAQVIQPEGSTVQQYTDGETWVVTLMSVSTSQHSAVAYANSIYESIKNGGGQNLTTGKSKIAGYTALTITATYPDVNKYLTTWCFESKLGQTHYLAIEGPSPSGDNYNIIYSFKEDK